MTMDPQKQQKPIEGVKKEGPNPGKPSENGEQGGGGGYRGRGGRGFGGSFRGGRGGRGGGRGAAMNNSSGEERGSFDGGRGGRGGGRGGGGRGGGGGGGGRGGFFDGKGGYQQVDRILERLKQIAGPQVDLAPREEAIRKFSNHCRLWIGNLPLDISEDDVRELFKPYGEFDEVYFDKNKGFAFVRMDYKSNAEKARQELHLKEYKNRQLKIRFSSPGTALKVRNLSTWVTNELFEKAFSVFGELEKAIVITDERGRSTGEGILEFCKKPCAQLALKRCGDGCFFLTNSPRPVIVEAMSAVDDNEGMAEINVNKRNPEYMKERQSGPRFAAAGSFEFEYGLKWKQLYELFDKKKEMLEKELNDEKQKLEEQIEYAKYQHETELLREKLRQREENNQAHQQEYEQRQQQWEEHRRIEEERQARIEEELAIKYRQQEEELRRRQEENRQFMQERGGSLLKEEAADELGNYSDHMGGGGGGWRRNEGGYGGGSGNWRGGGAGGAEAWGGRGGGAGGGRGAGQHWDRSGYQRGEDLAPAAQPPSYGAGRGRGGVPAAAGAVAGYREDGDDEAQAGGAVGGIPPTGDLFTGRLGGRARGWTRQAPDDYSAIPNKRQRF